MGFNRALPSKLNNVPIVEALFEVRFSGDTDDFAENSLGILLSADPKQKIETLPPASLPREILAVNPALAYQPSHRLHGRCYTVGLARRALTVACHRPYTGWAEYSAHVRNVLGIAQQLAPKVDRFSLAYHNLLEEKPSVPSLAALRGGIQIADYNFDDYTQSFRGELRVKSFNVVLTINTKIVATFGSPPKNEKGTYISVDVIRLCEQPITLNEVLSSLDEAHDVEKEFFFSILSDETYESLGPQ